MKSRSDTNRQTQPDLSGVHLWLVLWKATKALSSHADRSIASQNLGWSDFGVMEALLHKGPLPIKALGAKVLLTSGSITSAIDRLEQRGWVERTADGNDRRSRIVCLTPQGRTVIREAFASHKKHMEAATAGLNTADRRELIDLLRRLGQSAQAKLHEAQEFKAISKERK